MNPVKRAMKVLPHISIVMAGMMVVFFLIDRVNKPIGFMTNEFHRWLSFFLALFCLGYSVLLIAYQRKLERQEEQKRRRAMQARRAAAPAQSARPQARPAQTGRPGQTGRGVQGR